MELSDAECEELLQLCGQRLDAFRQQRGDDVCAHRSRHRTPTSGSVKYGVLTCAKALCIADAYPVTNGHSLVIPRRHVSDGLELHQPE